MKIAAFGPVDCFPITENVDLTPAKWLPKAEWERDGTKYERMWPTDKHGEFVTLEILEQKVQTTNK